jgi:hypothetical protein
MVLIFEISILQSPRNVYKFQSLCNLQKILKLSIVFYDTRLDPLKLTGKYLLEFGLHSIHLKKFIELWWNSCNWFTSICLSVLMERLLIGRFEWKKSTNQNSSFANGNLRNNFLLEFWGSVWLDFWKMKKKIVFELKLESPSKESESDFKNFIILTRSSASLFLWRFFLESCGHDLQLILHSPAVNFWVIGDQHHVLKSCFVFPQFLALTGNLPDYELKMENRLLWWKMFGALVGSWNEVF